MASVEPNPDLYGSAAQRSALADYLEIVAIYGKKLTEGELADTLEDNDWRLRNEPYVIGEGGTDSSGIDDEDDDDGGPESNFAESASLTFKQIDERATILGDRYPFEISKGRLRYRGASDDVYLFYLSVATLHAYDVPAPDAPWKIFESAVLRSLKSEWLLSASVSSHRRAGKTFADALTAAALELRMTARPEQMSFSSSAHDEGADVIVNYWWRDERAGHWIMVGQVTCSRDSSNWKRKMLEVEPSYWARGLGVMNNGCVSRFLALPYHVERDQLRYLVEKCNGVLLDRLRLTACRQKLEPDENAFVAKLRSGIGVFVPGGMPV
ncbi:MAG TPA: hypothetical protein VFG23_18475 [Polyangia bacterium]|nr:hypothetical protein [Polyangia bacterium]